MYRYSEDYRQCTGTVKITGSVQVQAAYSVMCYSHDNSESGFIQVGTVAFTGRIRAQVIVTEIVQ